MHENHQKDMRKLEIGLPYLLTHNREHEKDIRKWIQRAKEANQNGVADDLASVLELSRQISGYFEKALNKLKDRGYGPGLAIKSCCHPLWQNPGHVTD